MSDLEDVQSAVEKVERAVRDGSVPALLMYAVWIVALSFLISLGGKAWHGKWRYAFQYDVSSNKVQFEQEPHDCDFLAAPLGRKYCHYEISVLTVRWATSTAGLPINSIDEGKTWNTFTPDASAKVPKSPTVEEVYVSWEKKAD
jgi:hypothetical protein